jgi:hypothetical protein
MTSADVRTRLTHALSLDLIGPEPEDPQVKEILNVPPSRWYLTGFLVPSAAPLKQKQDQDDAQGELGLTEPATAADEDDNKDEAPAARRGQFPSLIGISVLVPQDATELRVTARWGDYTPREVGTRPDVEWDRRERVESVVVRLVGDKARKPTEPVPDSRGLEIVTSVRAVRRPEELGGLPDGTRAVSVFLVNRRKPEEGREELKDATFRLSGNPHARRRQTLRASAQSARPKRRRHRRAHFWAQYEVRRRSRQAQSTEPLRVSNTVRWPSGRRRRFATVS